ncbi:hypothetical protein CPB84DRAFT_1965899 [Gymnopilus junonius]|uniref:Uncharacterized protein n=1 Tax=Gymnopilus junonius TaxID=109634 RepID=A0A9P5TGY3_GYMJU|nr:hypothetical protein CPB84DRAFT_1965899 [Gymnopilus junonius]
MERSWRYIFTKGVPPENFGTGLLTDVSTFDQIADQNLYLNMPSKTPRFVIYNTYLRHLIQRPPVQMRSRLTLSPTIPMLRILKHKKASSELKVSATQIEESLPPYSVVDPVYPNAPVIPTPLPSCYYDQYAREYEEFIRARMNEPKEPKGKKRRSTWKTIFIVIGACLIVLLVVAAYLFRIAVKPILLCD